jgi:predicted phosphodiesterase
MSLPNHFSSPMLSNWQSAVAKTATSPASQGNPFVNALQRLPLDFGNALVSAGTYAAHAFQEGISGNGTPAPSSDLERCAKAALNLAMSKVLHDDEGVIAAQAQLAKDGTCDPRWAECIAEFVSHYALTRHADVPYRRWRTLNDFVDEKSLPDTCKIGIIGDWGTGDARALAALQQLATHKVQILIHLGDIYYSCTTAEANLFYDNLRRVFPRDSGVGLYSLCGNHDMYSGAAPYYALIDRLDHQASFFCLRNASWQILAGDTGYNDFDPRTHGSTGSWLQDFDDRDQPYSELVWHRDKFATAKGRRTLFLTHHQPFSRNSAIDGTFARSRKLLGQLQPNLGQIDLWLWGHEHNQVIYRPFEGVQRGRCVGASAIPVPKDVDLYRPDPAITEPVPDLEPGAKKLTVDPQTDLYNLGYAVITLDGRACTETYFEFDTSAKQERALFTNSF